MLAVYAKTKNFERALREARIPLWRPRNNGLTPPPANLQESTNKRSLVEALNKPTNNHDKKDLEKQRKKFKKATGGDEEEDEELVVQARLPSRRRSFCHFVIFFSSSPRQSSSPLPCH